MPEEYLCHNRALLGEIGIVWWFNYPSGGATFLGIQKDLIAGTPEDAC